MWKLLVAVVTVGALVLMLARLRTTANRARFLRQAGLVLMAMFTLVGVAWIAGEVFSDPGGWRAGGLVAMWFVPLAILLVISWYRVAWATVLLSVLTAGLVGVSIWFAADPEAWRAFENNNGPVRAIAAFVLAAPIALLGWRRPLPAGVMLLVLGLVPVTLSAAGTPSGIGSLAAVSIMPVLTGTLYLLAAAIARGASAHPDVPTTAQQH
jgi:hypothetical protein